MFWPRLTFAAALVFITAPLLDAGARTRRQVDKARLLLPLVM
jgi:hypothetical protein